MKQSTRLLLLVATVLAAVLLSINSAQAASVTISWDDNSSAETGYKVERAIGLTPLDSAFTVIGTTAANATTLIDTTVAEGVSYAYRVRAFTAAIFSAYSNTAAITIPLNAPTNTKAASTQQLAVNLGTGQAITVKNSTNATRPGSKTFNVPPGKQLLVSAN